MRIVIQSGLSRNPYSRLTRSLVCPSTAAMKVYTRTGDTGTTSLFNGSRVPKNDPRVDAYGTVDECNATVGLACSHLQSLAEKGNSIDTAGVEKLHARLRQLQNRLFDLGAHLATPRDRSSAAKLVKTTFPASAADDLEVWIDDMEERLEPLTTFILPGGHPAAASLHLARTVARRAERAVVPMVLPRTDVDNTGNTGDEATVEAAEMDGTAFCFLNRLSDFFFVASREVNRLADQPDVTWTKQKD